MGQRPSTHDKSFSSERYDGQSAGDMTGPRYQSSFNAQEQAPPYESMYGAAEQPEWNDCGVQVWTHDEKNQGTFPQNPFIYGAIPAKIKPKNVILFGETGVGKSSVINLMANAEVASTSANLEGCTLQATEYTFTLSGETSFRIYDTVGLNEPEMGVNSFFGAIEKAHKLVTSLHNAGGVDLLLFCIRGGRITATVQRNYRLFFEFLCAKKVPVALVVTHLEYEDTMENWWARNEKTFQTYGIRSIAHACITAAPARGAMFTAKRAESQYALQRMFHNSLSSPTSPYVKDVRSWFTSIIEVLWSFLMKSSSLKKKDLTKRLETRCAFSREEAQQLADMLAKGG